MPRKKVSNNGKNNLKREDYIPPGLKNYTGSDYDKDFAEDLLRTTTHEGEPQLSARERTIFRQALKAMNQAEIPYGVGASFARNVYTGIWRPTKDLDIFLKPEYVKPALKSLEAAGFRTEVEFEHWLAKGKKEKYQVDLIFGTGHGQLPVEDSWFENCQAAEILGVQTNLIAVEEMIASAAFVAERRRFDGSEIVHLILGVKGELDWQRILKRLGDNHELLLWHLILFDYIYPGHSDYLPQDLMEELFEEVRERWKKRPQNKRVFRGSLLDPFSFTVDLEDWGYKDRRNLDPLINQKGEAL